MVVKTGGNGKTQAGRQEGSLIMSAFSHIQLNVANLMTSTKFYLKTLSPLGFNLHSARKNHDFAELNSSLSSLISAG